MSKNVSLVAMYDDLCRSVSALTADDELVEEKFFKFAQNQEGCRKKWLAAELEVQRLSTILNQNQEEKATLEAKMKHCRKALVDEMNFRKVVEEERDSLKRQISVIQEILSDSNAVNDQTRERLAFLNSSHHRGVIPESPGKRLQTINESTGSVTSILSASDIDLTEDDIDNSHVRTRRRRSRRQSARRKRPSAPPMPTTDDDYIEPSKKIKETEISEIVDKNDSLIATTTVTIPQDGPITATSKIESIPKRRIETIPKMRMERSISAPSPRVETRRFPRLPFRSDGDSDEPGWSAGRDTLRIGTMPSTPTGIIRPGSRRYSLRNIKHRGHTFCTKTVMKPEKCTSCDKRIKFAKQALKCQDCGTTCHPDCKEQIPYSCTPPISSQKLHSGCIIADFAPKVSPMVPPLILHCIAEVESRGMTETGLYRISGSERERKELKERFLRGKGIPNLSKNDIHAVCGCIKDFLRGLREPLVTFALWKEFVDATETLSDDDCEDSLKNTISKLPQPNRDTLAFLIIHLQLVANTPDCKMPVSNLAKVFGPTIVGYSCPEPNAASMYSETGQQAALMEKLLNFSNDYWTAQINNITSDENGGFQTPQTPDMRPTFQNILGPITTSARRVSMDFLRRTPLAPRDSVGKTTSFKRRQQQFFASPMMK